MAAFAAVAAICWLRVAHGEHDRGAWALIAGSQTLNAAAWSPGLLWLSHLDRPPIPSVSDALWLADYPLLLAGIGLLARAEIRRALAAALLLDGAIASMGIAALGTSLLAPLALASAHGQAFAVAMLFENRL